MKSFKISKKIRKHFSVFMAIVLVFSIFSFQTASAAALTSISDIQTRLKENTLSSHNISFTLSGSTAFDAGETITIDFDEDGGAFNVNGASTVASDFDFNDGVERTVNMGSCPVGANNVQIAVNDTTGVVTITACSGYTSSSLGATINLKYGTAAAGGVDRVINPASGVYVVNINAAGDTGSFASRIIADDQIPVQATVNPTITFTVVNSPLDLGVLSSSSISTSGYNNITIGTNASNGYTISIYDSGSGSSPGLWKSAPPTKLIASANATPLSPGTEGYGGQCNKISGDGSCNFASTGDNVDGFLLTAKTFASYNAKPSGTDTFQIRVKATISSSTDAGTYSDTLTLIGTGNF